MIACLLSACACLRRQLCLQTLQERYLAREHASLLALALYMQVVGLDRLPKIFVLCRPLEARCARPLTTFRINPSSPRLDNTPLGQASQRLGCFLSAHALNFKSRTEVRACIIRSILVAFPPRTRVMNGPHTCLSGSVVAKCLPERCGVAASVSAILAET